MKSRNSRPPPIVQDSTGINEHIAMIGDFGVGLQVLDRDVVSAFLMVPVSSSNLMLSLDEALQSMPIGKSVKIVEDLFASSINT